MTMDDDEWMTVKDVMVGVDDWQVMHVCWIHNRAQQGLNRRTIIASRSL